jgi:hypothetical protein
MKIIDQNYRFHLQSSLAADWFLDCHLQIFHCSNQSQTVLAKYIVLVTGMGFEMGWFIPNLLESLVNEVVHQFKLDPQNLVWVEYYPLDDPKYHQDLNSTGFSLVKFNWEVGKLRDPHWMPITCQTLQSLIGQDLEAVLGRDLRKLLEMGQWYNTPTVEPSNAVQDFQSGKTGQIQTVRSLQPESVSQFSPTIRTVAELNRLFWSMDSEYCTVVKTQLEEG